MMFRRLKEPPAPPRQYNAQITPQLEATILRALARDPVQRYSNMAAFVADVAPPVERTSSRVASTAAILGPVVTTGPRLVITGTGATLALPRQEVVLIGRGASCDIDLGPHGGGAAGVSRQHARLLRSRKGWSVEDMDSTNGTFVNGVLVEPGRSLPVKHGDFVQCSRLTLIFYTE
jgi:pSer/pThr/pTyr-binding forkhead associated (FHA) protein